MTEIAKHTQLEVQQETTPAKAEKTAGTTIPEVSFSLLKAWMGLWFDRLTDSDEVLAEQRARLEQLLASSQGIERRKLQQKLRPIIMEQRFRRDPEAAKMHEQWHEVQCRAMDEYIAWEKEIKEKYGDEELGRRILAGEVPKYEYKPGEEELWYKLMRIEVEEGVRPEATLKFVKAREDAGGLRNWERQLQEQLSKEPGFPEPTQPSDMNNSTTKIADIQQELKTISSVHMEPEVEQ